MTHHAGARGHRRAAELFQGLHKRRISAGVARIELNAFQSPAGQGAGPLDQLLSADRFSAQPQFACLAMAQHQQLAGATACQGCVDRRQGVVAGIHRHGLHT